MFNQSQEPLAQMGIDMQEVLGTLPLLSQDDLPHQLALFANTVGEVGGR